MLAKSASTTFAPAFAKRVAVARPKPEAAPVTRQFIGKRFFHTSRRHELKLRSVLRDDDDERRKRVEK